MEHKRRNKKVAENAHSGQMFFCYQSKALQDHHPTSGPGWSL
jgi:hypothetical protein